MHGSFYFEPAVNKLLCKFIGMFRDVIGKCRLSFLPCFRLRNAGFGNDCAFFSISAEHYERIAAVIELCQ